MKKAILAILAMLSCFAFVACVPSNVEKAKEKMKAEGYLVLAAEDQEAEGLVGGFNATKSEGFGDLDNITALLFSSKSDAKKFYEDLGDKSKAIQDGKWVYWGTEDAIDDFKD